MEFCVTPGIGDITAEAFDALDCAAGAPSCHGRIRQREADGRWRVQYLRGCDQGQLQAVVPLFAPRAKSWPDPAYDPRAWGLPGLTEDDGLPRASMLVGGCTDLRSTLHVRPEVRDSWKFTEVLGQIARLAADEGRSLVFPYVYEETKNALTRASGDRASWQLLGREAVLSGVSDPGWEDGLSARARQYLRRDRRLIAESGVISQIRAWADVEDTACELIAAHNVAKGHPDHPEFVRMRFDQWAQCAEVECLAFMASTSTFRGVVAAMVWSDDLEMSEIGLDEGEGPERLAVYVDLVFRQALDFAQRRGLHNVRLGPEAERPKTSRGAGLRELFCGVITAKDVQEIASIWPLADNLSIREEILHDRVGDAESQTFAHGNRHKPRRGTGMTALKQKTALRDTTWFLRPNSQSRRLTAQATKLLPDGITRENIRRQPYAPVVASGHGSVLVDIDGDVRTDLVFSTTSLIHGHSYGPVVEAVAAQVRLLAGVSFPNGYEAKLAQLLATRVPFGDPLFRFTSSGSEAVMLGLRLASTATGRQKIVVFDHCYHGGFVPTCRTESQSSDYLFCPFNSPELLRRVFDEHGPEIAAVLADLCPHQGSLCPATEEFAEEIRQGCARYGAFLIADEVVSSRAAPRGMVATYGLQPDIVCLGKYIGGGLPIGAVAMHRDLGTFFAPDRQPRLAHGGTFNGNPLSMIAGIAALTDFSADQAAELDGATAAVCEELNKLFAWRDADWSVRCAGSLFHFWPGREQPSSPSQVHHDVGRGMLPHLSGFLLRHGVVIGPSGFGCLATATQPEDLDYLITAIDAYLSQ
jgi:glutamate-1-semialdehyde aminotransferase